MVSPFIKNLLLKKVIEPKLNEFGMKGIELPTNSIFNIRNIDIQLGLGYFWVNMDLF